MRKCYFLLLLNLFTCASSFAQANLRGKIVDDQSVRLPGAYVILEGTDFKTVTDISGEYAIYNVPASDYQLIVSYVGYDDMKKSLTLTDGETLIEEVKMDEGNVLTEVVINGRLEGQMKALNAQRNSDNIKNVVSAEQIERFPDANTGDALKRLPGVNVQYDQGEARFANIRGTSPELNSITINGERVPSAEAEQRFVQLDLIPSDVLETIEVNKAVTPDMDGDAIGGSVNLVTAKATPKQKIKGTIGSGYSFLTQKPLYKGKLSYSNRFGKDKFGIILNASVLDKHVRSDNVEAEWNYEDEDNKDGSAVPTDLQIRQYLLERLRQSYSATLDYQINKNHNIYINGMYNWRNDWENRYRTRYNNIERDDDGNFITQIRRQTKGGSGDVSYRRLEDQRMQRFGAGGEHFFNQIKMNWSVTSLKASEDRPNERYISMRTEDDPIITLDLTNLETPMVNVVDSEQADLSSAYELREITEEFQYTEENDLNARLDLELPILYGKNASFLKFGGRFKNKTKFRDNSFREYAPADEDAFTAEAIASATDQTQDNFSVGDYAIGSFVDRELLGDADLPRLFDGEDIFEEFAGNFDAKERVIGGYLMYTQDIGDVATIIAGLRYEGTAVDYAGKIFDEEEETIIDAPSEADGYGNLMPGIHLKISPNQWTNIRTAWTNTIARPNYFDLVPYQVINPDDNEISIGNPALEATTAMNFDLLAEHFFKNIGVISGGFFYKNLTNVIADQTLQDAEFRGNTYTVLDQPINAGNADILGLEFGVNRRLDFLPGMLSNLTAYANYTYTNSRLKDSELEGREDETLPLIGTPKNLLNTSLAYDTKKLDIRVSYNFAGAFIEEYSDEAFFDRWYDDVHYLDLNADYKLSNDWKIYLNINNLLNQPLRYYQGADARTMQVEYYGILTRLGIKFKITS